MLRDLTIKNYRCFKGFSIDGLARVNLIVGKNNSGKTSFLEAVYLLVNQGNPFSLLELLYNRGEYGEVVDVRREFDYQIAHIFHGHEPEPQQMPSICIQSQSDTPLSMTARLMPVNAFLNGTAGSPYQLQFRYGDAGCEVGKQAAESGINLPIGYNFAFRHTFTPAEKQPGPHQLVSPGSIDFHYVAKLWDRIISAPSKEELVVRGLKIVEPLVEDVRFTSQLTPGGVLLNLQNRASRLPISSLGDGMQRLLLLIMSAVNAENSLMFVDEIGMGLYHGVQTEMWRLLIEIAQHFHIQVFATTHSWDCVQSFQEALEATDQSLGLLFRLEQRFGQFGAVKYEAGELAVAVREAIEVR